ncbi:N-acetylneuraminate synthase family protein [Mycobacterium sp. G7A2]|uniref:N-acetylneuraminate synthase family protein n=1 Tax=Mycobacterium sp. G7A2 TaxID=3317307 RepID=UPI0035A87C6D
MVETPKVVAEIGCNHKGELDIAKELISTAAIFCKADYVKFQKRNNTELLSPEAYNAPHPNPANSYGATYGEHREYLEFSVDQHRELMDFCSQVGIGYSTSVWDVTSARQMATLEPDFLKVPSASNLHWEMLAVLCDEFGGGIQLSLGMTTRAEEEEIVSFFEARGRANDLLLYACTSGYPVAFDDICLAEITRLKEHYGSRVQTIGFSGHHLGIAADVAAVTLGATWVERHFTLDRTWKGTDHSASLEPDGMRRLVRDVRNVARALKPKGTEILPIEVETRRKLKWEPITSGTAV